MSRTCWVNEHMNLNSCEFNAEIQYSEHNIIYHEPLIGLVTTVWTCGKHNFCKFCGICWFNQSAKAISSETLIFAWYSLSPRSWNTTSHLLASTRNILVKTINKQHMVEICCPNDGNMLADCKILRSVFHRWLGRSYCSICWWVVTKALKLW